MRLLSSKEVDSVQKRQEFELREEKRKLEDLINFEIKELNSLQGGRSSVLEDKKHEFDQYVQGMTQKKAVILEEIVLLEQQRIRKQQEVQKTTGEVQRQYEALQQEKVLLNEARIEWTAKKMVLEDQVQTLEKQKELLAQKLYVLQQKELANQAEGELLEKTKGMIKEDLDKDKSTLTIAQKDIEKRNSEILGKIAINEEILRKTQEERAETEKKLKELHTPIEELKLNLENATQEVAIRERILVEKTEYQRKEEERLRSLQDKLDEKNTAYYVREQELLKAESSLAQKKAEFQIEMRVIESKRSTSLQQLQELEKSILENKRRREEEMRPIEEIRREAEGMRIVQQELEVAFNSRSLALQAREKELRDAQTALVSQQQALQQNENDLNSRQKQLEKLILEAQKIEDGLKVKQETLDLSIKFSDDKAKSYYVLMREVQQKSRKLDDERKHLESQQDTLKQAWNEARIKGVV